MGGGLEYVVSVSPDLEVTGLQGASSHHNSGIEDTHSGRTRNGWMLGILAVMVVVLCCGGCDDTDESADRQHVIGGDLLLVMEPGEGPGEFADELAALVASPFGGVRQGTPDHVASFDGEYGPAHVVTFTAGRENPRGGDPEFCVWVGSSMSCRVTEGEPMVHGWGWGGPGPSASAYGGPQGAEAVFTTEFGKTVSVLAVGGYAYAEWAEDWGKPQTVAFYDAAGNRIVKLDFATGD